MKRLNLMFVAGILLSSFFYFPNNPIYPATANQCAPDWKKIKSPNLGELNSLSSVIAFSANKVWASGRYINQNASYPLLVRWNGNAWIAIEFPFSTPERFFISKLSASSPKDIWGIVSARRDFIIHWNGKSWQLVTDLPRVGKHMYLRSIIAIAADDVWAVGYSESNEGMSFLALHWNGKRWRNIVIPSVPYNFRVLLRVAASGTNDVWAVGESEAGSLIFHWDGNTWRIIEQTNAHDINALAALAPDDVWAVGYQVIDNAVHPYTQHWDGTSWNQFPTPYVGDYAALYQVVALSTNDVWAMGVNAPDEKLPSTNAADTNFALHWDGVAWEKITIPELGSANFNTLAADKEGNLWGVGSDGANSLTVRYGMNARTHLVMPLSHSTLFAAPIKLKWRKLDCATRYQLVVRENSSEGQTVIKKNNLRRARYLIESLEKGVYVWRVRTCSATHCGIWSRWNNFTLQ